MFVYNKKAFWFVNPVPIPEAKNSELLKPYRSHINGNTFILFFLIMYILFKYKQNTASIIAKVRTALTASYNSNIALNL
jgi:hypothetical protein